MSTESAALPLLPAPAAAGALRRAGLPADALVSLLDTLGAGLDPHALTIARRGTVLLRTAWAPYRADRPALVYSASKTVIALAVGLLESEGRIALTDPVDRYLDLPNPYGFTVHHLLTMTTGHSRQQTLAMSFGPQALLTTAPVYPVGSRFAYNSPASALLARLVHAVSGEQPTAYLRPRLLDPLGIGSRWWRSSGGVEQGFSGLHLTVDDLARIGVLLADGGRFGERQVLPASFVTALSTAWAITRPSTPNRSGPEPDGHGEPDPDVADWSLGYGYHIWRSRHGFRLDGAYGQLALVVPSRDLVIAYQGATTDVQRTLDAFWRVVEACDPVDPAPAEAPSTSTLAAESALTARLATPDSWDSRLHLVPQAVPGPDHAGWSLTDHRDGWTLALPTTDGQPGGTVAVPPDRWGTGALTPPDDTEDEGEDGPASDPVGVCGWRVPVAARGERLPDGSVRVHLVVTTAPHRLLLTRDPSGRLDARWHTVPLWQPTLSSLLVPPVVAAPPPTDPASPPVASDHPTPEP